MPNDQLVRDCQTQSTALALGPATDWVKEMHNRFLRQPRTVIANCNRPVGLVFAHDNTSAPLGEYIILDMPYRVKVAKMRVYGLSGSPNDNNNRQGPERGDVWVSNDGISWEYVSNFVFGDYQPSQWKEFFALRHELGVL